MIRNACRCCKQILNGNVCEQSAVELPHDAELHECILKCMLINQECQMLLWITLLDRYVHVCRMACKCSCFVVKGHELQMPLGCWFVLHELKKCKCPMVADSWWHTIPWALCGMASKGTALGSIYGWMNAWTNKRRKEWMTEWIIECMNEWMYVRMHDWYLQNVSSIQGWVHQVTGGSLHVIDTGCSQGGGPVAQVDGLLLCPTPQHHRNPVAQADTTYDMIVLCVDGKLVVTSEVTTCLRTSEDSPSTRWWLSSQGMFIQHSLMLSSQGMGALLEYSSTGDLTALTPACTPMLLCDRLCMQLAAYCHKIGRNVFFTLCRFKQIKWWRLSSISFIVNKCSCPDLIS